jgi:hypothetical protein
MFSEGLADVEIDENCGYIDGGGTVIIPLKYDVCYRFIEGTAVVEDSDGVSYLINKKGGVLETPTKVDRIHRPEPGIEAFWDDSKSAAGARLDGKIVIEPKFQSLGNFKEGRSIAKVKNRWGVIDDKGKFILPPTYEDMFHFYEGLAWVVKDEKYGYIDRDGRLVIDTRFDRAGVFSHGLAAVIIAGKVGYIDKKGRLVIPAIFDEMQGGAWDNFEKTD